MFGNEFRHSRAVHKAPRRLSKFTCLLAFSSQWISVYFCLQHKAVGTMPYPDNDWIGTITPQEIGQVVDMFAMTTFGGIPWQVSKVTLSRGTTAMWG